MEDLHRELTSQYQRFVELIGRKPAYFEAHAVCSTNLYAVLEQVATEEKLFYQPAYSDFTLGGTYVINTPVHNMEPGYNARRAMKENLSQAQEGSYHLYVCHPGYLDSCLRVLYHAVYAPRRSSRHSGSDVMVGVGIWIQVHRN